MYINSKSFLGTLPSSTKRRVDVVKTILDDSSRLQQTTARPIRCFYAGKLAFACRFTGCNGTLRLFDAFYGSHDGHGLPLNQHKALRQELYGLQLEGAGHVHRLRPMDRWLSNSNVAMYPFCLGGSSV